MSALPKSLSLSMMQSLWSTQLNPLIANTILQGVQLSNVALVANTPQTLNHKLGRQQVGWFITDINASATVWRTQPFNGSTLTLEASATCTVSIWMY